jgi:hypothetical protein
MDEFEPVEFPIDGTLDLHTSSTASPSLGVQGWTG